MGYDFAEVLKSTSGLGVPTPYLVDTQKTVKELEWIYKNGTVSLDLDFSGLTFPVTLRNTTVHLVMPGGTDLHEFIATGNTWENTEAVCLWSGNQSLQSMVGFRWTANYINQGDEIITAYAQFKVITDFDDIDADWYFEKNGSPGQLGYGLSEYDISDRSPVTSSVYWHEDNVQVDVTGWSYSPDLSDQIQEIIDDHTPAARYRMKHRCLCIQFLYL